MTSLSPREIVSELDRYIVGQKEAKQAVAIALRNRYRRQHVAEPLRHEIVPKNILMIGPTGVGKTEIARRLAKLADAPFLKVEATKFTEVGYVGRDVDSIIRDLTDVAMNLVRERMRREVRVKAEVHAEERVLDALVGEDAREDTRQKFRKKLRENELNEKEIEIQVKEAPGSGMPMFDIPGMPGSQMGMINISDMLGKAMGGAGTKTRRMTVADAYEVLIKEESDKLLDEEKVVKEALSVTENSGIVFIDEIDKITTRSDTKGGEVSREGVQRDLLPILEGTTVTTKYGIVKTDYILFIASGAFHIAKPSDLLPELQGRLPIRVQLQPLTEDDLVRILTEPEASLTKQYEALIATEKVPLTFTEDGVREIARIATEVNQNVENIGARRLHTVVEKLLEDISFRATDMEKNKPITIDAAYVKSQLSDISKQQDLSKFIL
ncbi:MAG: ATP-dependent protease ATPase subunit HslU [Proteobacteria bacterium]|nr:ATP-dependent protease ATPase subunit HslU [Pseudomonadota bacterium]